VDRDVAVSSASQPQPRADATAVSGQAPAPRREKSFWHPQMAALTVPESLAVVVALVIPGLASAILGWSFWPATLACVPGLVVVSVLRYRANRSRPRKPYTHVSTAAAVVVVAGTNSASAERYFTLLLAVVFWAGEQRRRARPSVVAG
jgi:hypothetical protein